MKKFLIGVAVGVVGKIVFDRYGYLLIGAMNKGIEKTKGALDKKEQELQEKTGTKKPDDVEFEPVE